MTNKILFLKDMKSWTSSSSKWTGTKKNLNSGLSLPVKRYTFWFFFNWKEEDNLIMEKYKRADEAKIKDLNLLIEKLTIEVSESSNALNTEITET